VGLHGGIVDAGGGLEALHRQHEVAHLALLPLELGEPRALSRREKFRGADAALELGAPRLGAQVPLVVGERDAGLGEHAFGGLRGNWPPTWKAGSCCTASRSASVLTR